MTSRQLEHHEICNRKQAFPLVLIGHDITSPENLGMLFRMSEAMGVAHFYLSGNSPSASHRRVKKTARSTVKYVQNSRVSHPLELMSDLKKRGYTLVALEVTNDSQILHQVDFSSFEKIALIPGNEQDGLAPEILEAADLSIEIPMYGHNTSINVVNAVSIALYEIRKQLS